MDGVRTEELRAPTKKPQLAINQASCGFSAMARKTELYQSSESINQIHQVYKTP
jgi:hypothetical protein